MGLTNSFWYRGYDPRLQQTVILVGLDLDEGRKLFRSCVVAAKNTNPLGVENEESTTRHAANALACLLRALPPLRAMSPAWVNPRLAVEFCFGDLHSRAKLLLKSPGRMVRQTRSNSVLSCLSGIRRGALDLTLSRKSSWPWTRPALVFAEAGLAQRPDVLYPSCTWIPLQG